MGEKRNAHSLSVGKPEGKRSSGRPRHRWVDNIQMDLGETEWGGMAWIDLAHNRYHGRALMKMDMYFRIT
jgi:hypothetical protein